MELEDVIKVHSIGYGLEDVKVEFKHDLKMDVSGVQIEGKENEMMNIPRWVADILESEKHVVLHDQDMIKELKQAKVKEDIADEDSLATLDKHFYIKLHAYMKKLETTDFDKAESMLNQLVRIRQGKIVRLADSKILATHLGMFIISFSFPSICTPDTSIFRSCLNSTLTSSRPYPIE